MIVLKLPVPISVNAMYRNVAGIGRVKTGKYKAWVKLADQWLMTQKRGRVSGPCELEIRIPASSRGDASNRIKICEDYLVSREITDDDRNNWRVSIWRDKSLTDHCVVTIREADETRALADAVASLEG